ncbi:MAG TPA: hydroxymyristoyl-ACP dehydratase [Rudaea sp.]|nr:hydroxymyristoyl-ACP dehydratase [Rudaea sp.]
MQNVFCEQFHIAASHAALPGHFPGAPVVPGVVLLDRLADLVERRLGRRIAALPQVKFLRPLLPGEDAELTVEGTVATVHFRIESGGGLVASGRAELGP